MSSLEKKPVLPDQEEKKEAVLPDQEEKKEAVVVVDQEQHVDRKSTRLNSSHITRSRMPSSA